MTDWHNIDKSEWGPGPWQTEPDKRHWVDPATGLNCLIVRNGGGALCGYVGLHQGHPAYGQSYDEPNVDCHGGLTFSGGCNHSTDPGKGICHIPAIGEADDVFWFGFDCVHWQDFSPARAARYRDDLDNGTYRTIEWVEAEVTRLAQQFKMMEVLDGPA
jgi:hypothetical protein